MSLLIDDIGQLVTNADPAANGVRGALGIRLDAAMAVDEGRVAWVGAREAAPPCDERISVEGRTVLPGFVDSHTHLVFAGDRVEEFAARMVGRPYAAGGIASTVAATRAASDAELLANARRLATEAAYSGTTTLETKSGYGLTVADEARSVAVARRVTDETTFLGAHVVPAEFADRRDHYVELVCGPMLTAAVDAGARWIDVFCDEGAFNPDETRAVLAAGKQAGLVPRLHGNQLAYGAGVSIAVESGAASVDHCTYLSDADVEGLATSDTVATLLPAAEFSTRSTYPDARRLLDAGCTVAIATDCNPGSSYTTSMPLCIALAVREMHLSCDEALWAATAGGARALRRDDIGHLGVGARADFIELDAPSYEYLAYRPGVQLVRRVWKGGRAWPYGLEEFPTESIQL